METLQLITSVRVHESNSMLELRGSKRDLIELINSRPETLHDDDDDDTHD
jgi:hypothetical protein